MAMDFSKKCEVLAELWMNYRQDEELKDFTEYNDLGLPLAYIGHTELGSINESGKIFIDETYNLFCVALGLDEEMEYENLNAMLEKHKEE
jgi:hypothetical protein